MTNSYTHATQLCRSKQICDAYGPAGAVLAEAPKPNHITRHARSHHSHHTSHQGVHDSCAKKAAVARGLYEFRMAAHCGSLDTCLQMPEGELPRDFIALLAVAVQVVLRKLCC